MADQSARGPRCAALVGPYGAGKTVLLEALLFAAGATSRKGSMRERNTVGDASPVARERGMSTELNVAGCEFMGDRWTLLDCPGSIEFAQDVRNALPVVDFAVVVVDPDPAKAPLVAPLLKLLDDLGTPHAIFINKMDTPGAAVADVMAALGAASARPLVLRHLPIMQGEAVGGYVDLISQRAYRYRKGAQSDVVELTPDLAEEESAARQALLERLADFDDALLEQLLEDMVPDQKDIYRQLVANVAKDNIVPVMLGAAETQSGVFRLWKSLRHDAPGVVEVAVRRGVDPGKGPAAQVFKTVHARAGKLSHARALAGEVAEGATLGGERIAGLFHMLGQQQTKIARAAAGEVVALGRMEQAQTGERLTATGKSGPDAAWPAVLPPVYAVAIRAAKRDDEVKLSAALQRLVEEDPSYSVEHNADTHELVLRGQGEIHLAVAAQTLQAKYNVAVTTARPQVPYKETIRKAIEQHARHKKQSGGHGQFGDVKLEIGPRPRGAGFEFSERVVGGAVPRQFISSVETGVRETLARGPLGFPVVDVGVCLFDGQYHTVDSSDMAFRTAAGMAMREGMPKCEPVLLEPIGKVEIDAPAEFTSRVNQLVTGRRGQILGFDAKPGWSGWETVSAYIPEAEMHGLIVDLRSMTQGAGTYRYAFDHLQELTGREADQVVSQRAQAAAA
ncbi:MAG: elongation factor G [Alphaproteobacteria bacterium]|nr:elongation factor G [Alphaproteobacteria bacterium]